MGAEIFFGGEPTFTKEIRAHALYMVYPTVAPAQMHVLNSSTISNPSASHSNIPSLVYTEAPRDGSPPRLYHFASGQFPLAASGG